ncbi:hypothetical protein FKM82_017579 [Ascaphus truei]
MGDVLEEAVVPQEPKLPSNVSNCQHRRLWDQNHCAMVKKWTSQNEISRSCLGEVHERGTRHNYLIEVKKMYITVTHNKEVCPALGDTSDALSYSRSKSGPHKTRGIKGFAQGHK